MKLPVKRNWIIGAVILFVIIALSIVVSNMERRRAIETSKTPGLGAPTDYDKHASDAPAAQIETYVTPAKGAVVGGIVGAAMARPSAEARLAAGAESKAPTPSAYDANHKIIRTASLDLIVTDVRQAIDQIRRDTANLGGYVERANLTHTGDNVSGTITVRVPQLRLDQALAGFKRGATRVENESVESSDVTKQFVDTESQLRNFRAEEQQYLVIMRTAKKVQDTLDVAEKLSDVRGRIEALQGELNYLSNEVDMSRVAMSVRPRVTAVATAFEWHPIANARAAYRDMLRGLADFGDFVIAALVYLPLVVIWTVFIGAVVFLSWRLGKWSYNKLRASPATVSATRASE